MKKLIGIEELAEAIGFAPNTIRQWVSMKKIPYYKVGRLVRFDTTEIDKWLETMKVEEFKLKPLSAALAEGLIERMTDRKQSQTK